MYKAVHLSSECYPIAKTGGLGDVVGALPKYLNMAGYRTCVILPLYNQKWNKENKTETFAEGSVKEDRYSFDYLIKKVSGVDYGFDIYLVDIPDLLFRENIYGYDDDAKRFLFFQLASLAWICSWEKMPNVFHCHDNHTGYIPFMTKYCYRFSKLIHVKTVFTIHNGLYTGAADWDLSKYFPDFSFHNKGYLDWDNKMNPLAAGVKCCDFFTTVSQGYLEELRFENNSLQWLFNEYIEKSKGIINGIDNEVWDPTNDPYLEIPMKKDWSTFKQKNKVALLKITDMNPELPLMVFIGRLVPEKGGDILALFIGKYLSGNRNLNFYILGSGASQCENQLTHLSNVYSKNIIKYIGYNEELAHRLYASADFLIMPSLVEPCGLNQLYAMRYAAIPVVSSVGGLKDTVVDIEELEGYGICFDKGNIEEIIISLQRSVKLYEDKSVLKKVRDKITQLNFSWVSAVKQYIEIYKK